MPQKSKFTQALEDDANKDKMSKVGLGMMGAGAAGIAGLSAKKKVNRFEDSIIANHNFGLQNPMAGNGRFEITTDLVNRSKGSLMTPIGDPGHATGRDIATAYKSGLNVVTPDYKVDPKNPEKNTGTRFHVEPQVGRTKKQNIDMRADAQKRVVPLEEDYVVEAKRAADRRTAIRKGMGQNMARTGKATPWTQPAKGLNIGNVSSRFLKSIGYTGPAGLTTQRSGGQPEPSRKTNTAEKPKTELLANIKRNVARSERAPDVTPASTHTGRALQFDRFSKQASSRGFKPSPVDAVKIGYRHPVGKGSLLAVLGTGAVGGAASLIANAGAGNVVRDAKTMAGPITPKNTGDKPTGQAPVIDEAKAAAWDSKTGAVASRIKYDLAVANMGKDERAAAFVYKYQKDNPKLFKKK